MAWYDDLFKLFQPQTLLGGALSIGGSLADKEPGEVLEGRQFLRNLFTAPLSRTLAPETQVGTGFLSRQVQAPSDPFAPGGIYERYLPVFQREEAQRRKGFESRLSLAYPSDVSLLAQGPVQESSRRLEGELQQNRNALIADLLREQQTRQTTSAQSLLNYGLSGADLQRGAARDVLEFSRPDPTASAISQLGTMLMMDKLLNRGGTGSTAGLGGLFGGDGTSLDSFIRSLLGGGGGGGGGGIQSILQGLTGGGGGGGTIQSILQAIANPESLIGSNLTANPLVRALLGTDPASKVGMLTNISQLFPTIGQNALQKGLGLVAGAPGGAFATLAPETGAAFTKAVSKALGGQTIGAFEQIGNGAVAVLAEDGSVIGTVGANGSVTNAAGQAVSTFGSTLGTMLSGAAVAAGAFAGARSLTGFLESRNIGQGSTAKEIATGVASGAAMGAALGSFLPGIGTAIGAIIGAIAGGFGGAGAERRREDAQMAQEAQITNQQRPAVLSEVDQTIQTFQQLYQEVLALEARMTPEQQAAFRTSREGLAASAVESRIRDGIDRITNWRNISGPGQQALATTTEVGHLETGLGNIRAGLDDALSWVADLRRAVGVA